MFQSRDQIRQVYIDVWQKMQNQTVLEPMEAIIADIIELHPEYQPLLGQQEQALEKDYTPEGGESNPFLHMGMHIALREQANTNNPAGFQVIYQNLLNKLGKHEAEHAMMSCLAEALWRSQKDNLPFDEDAYLVSFNVQ